MGLELSIDISETEFLKRKSKIEEGLASIETNHKEWFESQETLLPLIEKGIQNYIQYEYNSKAGLLVFTNPYTPNWLNTKFVILFKEILTKI
jgi:hypothetical protein